MMLMDDRFTKNENIRDDLYGREPEAAIGYFFANMYKSKAFK